MQLITTTNGRAARWVHRLAVGIVALVLIVAPAIVPQQSDAAPDRRVAIGVDHARDVNEARDVKDAAYVNDSTDLSTSEIAARIYATGESMGASRRLHLAALATGLVESGGGREMRNLPPELSDNDANPNKPSPGSVTSVGVFQQQKFLPWTKDGRNRMNVSDAARTFYEQARTKDRPGRTVGQLAQAVQGSAYPSKYDLAVPRAREILAEVEPNPPEHSQTTS